MIKKGTVLSEIQFYVIDDILPNGNVVVRNDNNQTLTLQKGYVEALCEVADAFATEEKLTATALAELFINSKGKAMTVAYITKDKDRTKKDIAAEEDSTVQQLLKDALSVPLEKLLRETLKKVISPVIPGELRVMKGRHYGNMNDLGRISFIDMELPLDLSKPESRNRLVDPRTIQYIIVDNVKYSLK